jgi:putative nucleotidyltransferase with HDIG domain
MDKNEPSPVAEGDEDFVPIRAQNFLSGSKAFFDVFVRLSSGKYLKLLQAGDNFTPDRLDNYLQKGVTHFHIYKSSHDQYIKYCSRLSLAMLRAKGISTDLKVGQTLNQGEEVLNFLKYQGVSNVLLEHASQFVSNIRELIQQLEPGAGELMKGFMTEVAAYEHGVGTAMLAGILAHVIEIRMEKTVQIVGMASLLHDIGLLQLPEQLWDEDESKMNEDERRSFRTHHAVGAEMLRSISGMDPGAIQAVEQHHMRPNGLNGFPERVEAGQVTRLSEIVGICDEFNHYLRRARNDPQMNVLAELEKRVFPHFSRQVVYAFRSSFFPKKA